MSRLARGSIDSGALAGLALAVPLGPMAILLIGTTLKHGRKIGFFGALAMASVDFAYGAIVFAFGSFVINFLTGWLFPLRVLGSAILIYVAITIFINTRKSTRLENSDTTESSTSGLMTYAKFFGLTVLNPATAFFFFGITPSLSALAQGTGSLSILLFAVGVFLGSIVWQLSLVLAAQLTKSFTNERIEHRIQYLGATRILALAIGLLLR
jgi:threonine/homoserine/homoserine lactone efflux protein